MPDSEDTAGLTSSDVIGLVTVFERMLLAMENRLVAKMEENTQGAKDRWGLHDRDSERVLRDIADKFLAIEQSIELVEQALNLHLKQEADEDLQTQARVRPVLTLFQYLAKNWRTILLLIVSMLAILGFSGETLNKLLGR